ncbi:MAG: DUF3276 family protein [Spirochaetota bacterium]
MRKDSPSNGQREVRNTSRGSGSQRSSEQGYRGEIYTRRFKYNTNSYFFNLKENREGSIYLNIVESRECEGRGFKRHSLLIFAEQRKKFASTCLESLEALAEGRDYHQEIESPQRSFQFQIQKKRYRFLSIREASQHYGKPIQAQIQIAQDCAGDFSRILIEIMEKWLERESSRTGAVRKKVLRTMKPPREPSNPYDFN